MRAVVVWTIAGVCGLVAFGSTLVVRAPNLPSAPRAMGFASPRGPGILPADTETLKNEVRNTPNEFAARYDLARRYEWAGQSRESTETWRELARSLEPLVRDGSDPRTTFVFAEARHALHEADEGREHYEKVIELYRQRIASHGDSALVYYRMGWCARRLGDAAAMDEYFNRAEEVLSKSRDMIEPMVHYLLAAMRAMRGYNGQSIGEIEALIRMGIDDRQLFERAEEFENLRGDAQLSAALAKIPPPKAKTPRPVQGSQ
jgi:tetratricopeptide (TPR) repeat protein